MNITQDQAEFEQAILEPWSELCEALEYSGLQQERRNLFVMPNNLDRFWLTDDQLELGFELPSGSYATSLLREFASIVDYGLSKYEQK